MIRSLDKTEESNIQFERKAPARVWRFDHSSHGLSHTMKAADFVAIAKTQDKSDHWYIIEIKNPNRGKIHQKEKHEFENKVQARDKLAQELAQKFRDTLMYIWVASKGKVDKAHYYVFLPVEKPLALALWDRLKRLLPTSEYAPSLWQGRSPCLKCAVFTTREEWNERVPWFIMKDAPQRASAV